MDYCSFSHGVRRWQFHPLVDPNNLGLVEITGQLGGVVVDDVCGDEFRRVVSLPLDQEAGLPVDLPCTNNTLGLEASLESVVVLLAAARVVLGRVSLGSVAARRLDGGGSGTRSGRSRGQRGSLFLVGCQYLRRSRALSHAYLFLPLFLIEQRSVGPLSLGKIGHLLPEACLEFVNHVPRVETIFGLPRVVAAVVALPLDEVAHRIRKAALVDDLLDHILDGFFTFFTRVVPVSISISTSTIADGATSIIADGATSIIADGATSIIADGATSKASSVTKREPNPVGETNLSWQNPEPYLL
jgi:hypothetical protein